MVEKDKYLPFHGQSASSVGIANWLWAGRPTDYYLSPTWTKSLFPFQTVRPALGLNQPPIQWEPTDGYLFVRRAGGARSWPLTFSYRFKMPGSIPSLSQYALTAWYLITRSDIFTFKCLLSLDSKSNPITGLDRPWGSQNLWTIGTWRW